MSQHKHYRKGTMVYPELCRTNSLGLCTGWWAHEWSGKSLRNCKDLESREEVIRKVPVNSSPEKESKIRERKNMTKMLGAASANETKMLTSFTPHRDARTLAHQETSKTWASYSMNYSLLLSVHNLRITSVKTVTLAEHLLCDLSFSPVFTSWQKLLE